MSASQLASQAAAYLYRQHKARQGSQPGPPEGQGRKPAKEAGSAIFIAPRKPKQGQPPGRRRMISQASQPKPRKGRQGHEKPPAVRKYGRAAKSARKAGKGPRQGRQEAKARKASARAASKGRKIRLPAQAVPKRQASQGSASEGPQGQRQRRRLTYCQGQRRQPHDTKSIDVLRELCPGLSTHKRTMRTS